MNYEAKYTEIENEQHRKWILEYLYDGLRKSDIQFKGDFKAAIAWLKKLTPVDKEEILKGARRYVALSIMDFIDVNTQGMCMSNAECKNLEDAVVNSNWAKVYAFMKMKLEKQDEKDSQVTLPQFTLDDILALQSCMKTAKEVQEDKDLYEILNDLHGRVYDAYQLEKQGNKPQGKSTLETVKDEKVDNADKVKPKFDVDDWITDGEYVWKIGYIEDDMYIERRGTISGGGTIKSIDKRYHLWTIADAKAGDVLVSVDDEYPFIYKGCLDPEHPNSPVAYCGLDLKGDFGANSRKLNHWWTDTTVHPATKEQQDLLFAKMKEAGYEWDEEKLELKKIANDNAEQHERYLGWLKKDADMLDFLMALFEDTFPNMTFRPLAHMDRKEPITSKDIVDWLDNLRPIVDYTYVWHDATKELPPPPKRKGSHLSEYVLAYDKHGIFYKSAYDYSKKCWMYNNYFVTHWAYLPEPPKIE